MLRDFHIVLFDLDIGYHKVFNNNNINVGIPFSLNLDNAKKYAKKYVKLALEKGALGSYLPSSKNTYPIHGYLIFTVKFIEEPTTKELTNISREDFNKLLQEPSKSYDVTIYTPNWSNDQRYILNPSAYPKLKRVHIKFIKINNLDSHTVFCFYNNSPSLSLEDIQLLKLLLSNRNGMSYSRPTQAAGFDELTESLEPGPIGDPYYEKYLKYKRKYLNEIG